MSTADLKSEIDQETEKLNALVRQRDGVDRQIEIAKSRLEAYHRAYAIVTKQTASGGHNGEAVVQKNAPRPPIRHADPWEDALIVMQEKGGQFTTDAILVEARSRGSDITRPRARGRLAHLVERRSLLRLREGVFEFPRDEHA